MSTDVTQNLDTEGVIGNLGSAPSTSGAATVKQTTSDGSGGSGASDNNKAATQPDTTSWGAGTSPKGLGSPSAPGQTVEAYQPSSEYSQGQISQNLDTLTGGGSPIQNANPAYRAPSGDVPATDRDTTYPGPGPSANPLIGGGEPVYSSRDTDPYGIEQDNWLTTNLDTVNPRWAMQTTGSGVPAAPASAPTATGVNSGVNVAFSAVADPANAHVRGYRIEAVHLAPGVNPGSNTKTSAAGTVFVGRGSTSAFFADVVPGDRYAFRYAAVNDNGTGAFSAWSNGVVPLDTDEVPTGSLAPGNTVNPIYRPDGTIKPGTGGVSSVSFRTVALGDEFTYEEGTDPALGHATPGGGGAFVPDPDHTDPDGDVTFFFIPGLSDGEALTIPGDQSQIMLVDMTVVTANTGATWSLESMPVGSYLPVQHGASTVDETHVQATLDLFASNGLTVQKVGTATGILSAITVGAITVTAAG